MEKNLIKIVVGSWHAYNNCNSKALGSDWITLNDLKNVEELEEILTKQGFDLKGEDAELFIQDIEGISPSNCDYINPFKLFELLQDSEILEDENKYKKAISYINIFDWNDFKERVKDRGSCWDDDIYFYEDQTLEDVAYEIVEECYDLPEIAQRYFDYSAFARDLSFDGYYETNEGVLEVR